MVVMQRRHPARHLFWRGGVAAVSHAMMMTGLYPLVPHAVRAVEQRRLRALPLCTMLGEWAISAALSVARPAGFLPLPGARTRGPRPIIVLHGYAQNRAIFMPLAWALQRAGLGPVYGFEYWTLGRIAAGARQLGWFVDEVRERSGAAEVDLIGHSMGGIVARYYAAIAGGDAVVRNLVTIGSPHGGTAFSKIAIGHATRELVLGSQLCQRLAAAPPLQHAKLTSIWSLHDALVPGALQPAIPGAEILMYEDLGHVAMLGSRRVAREIIQRLR